MRLSVLFLASGQRAACPGEEPRRDREARNRPRRRWIPGGDTQRAEAASAQGAQRGPTLAARGVARSESGLGQGARPENFASQCALVYLACQLFQDLQAAAQDWHTAGAEMLVVPAHAGQRLAHEGDG